ncbi:MAG: rod shape-determining protein MreC [Leptolinea sp.]|nr:rod shape-determining protein MreC [Leptolinea sp.]
MKLSTPGKWRPLIVTLFVAGIVFLALAGYLAPIIRMTLNPIVDLQSWISTRYTALYDFVTVPRDVASLRQQNAVLTNENSRLQTQIIQLQQQLREAEVLYALLDFARSRPENEYVASAVIGRDPSPFLSYVIIDHGSDDGIRHGMPVVTQQGLVGRVDAVTASASRLQLITDPGSTVNVRLQSTQTETLLQGSITGDLTLEMIPQETKLNTGDLVLTSGLGGSYPSDVIIGQVISIQRREGELFQTASIQPAVDFAQLQAVLVITNFKPVDIEPLTPELSP